jgi:putative N-acetyltransferase (TIGR04045 family)
MGAEELTHYSDVLAGLPRPALRLVPDRTTTTAAEPVLAGLRAPAFTVRRADTARDLAAYRQLRQQVFVTEQGLFTGGNDHDDVDDDPRTVVLVATSLAGEVLGGVRLGPVTDPDIGWWQGGRLAVRSGARGGRGVGATLVTAACRTAVAAGAVRFDATVQPDNAVFFERLGWLDVGAAVVAGQPHRLMHWPIDRIAALVAATKSPLADLVGSLVDPGLGWRGDDAAPVPASDLVAACDAILPAMVAADPEWAGWCAVLVNINDLAAMGARPVGLLDALAAPDTVTAARVIAGMRAAAQAYGVPILGGHTQLGVPAALSITALGHAPEPVPAGGGQAGDVVSLLADLSGDWRPGYVGRQWDSTTGRRGAELRAMVDAIGSDAAIRPAAAKDVSMAGLVGTLGMLAEASGCGAALDVATIPRPDAASMGDWLTCFPGFALLTASRPGQALPTAPPATSAACGHLTAGEGVTLRWPDGRVTTAVTGAVTGLGAA